LGDSTPGWYRDEHDERLARWHDGHDWTEHTLVIADQPRGAIPPAPAEQPDPLAAPPVPTSAAPTFDITAAPPIAHSGIPPVRHLGARLRTWLH
jgi:hypothetical protein